MALTPVRHIVRHSSSVTVVTQDGLKACVNGQLTAEATSCRSNTRSRNPLALLYNGNKAKSASVLLRSKQLNTHKTKQIEQKQSLCYQSTPSHWTLENMTFWQIWKCNSKHISIIRTFSFLSKLSALTLTIYSS